MRVGLPRRRLALSALLAFLSLSPVVEMSSRTRTGLVTILVFGVLLACFGNGERVHDEVYSGRTATLCAVLVGIVGVGTCLLYAESTFAEFLKVGYDDSFITFRYAQNLSNLDGLRFNPGDPSNSASSLLFVLLLALVDQLTPLSLLWAANCLNLLGLFFLIFLPTRELARRTSLIAALAVGLGASVCIATFPPLTYWTFSGMETTFFMGLLALVVVLGGNRLVVQPETSSLDNGKFLLAVVLLTLTRVEGALVGGTICLLVLLPEISQRGIQSLKSGFNAALLLASPLTLAIQLGFYWVYYSSPISDPIHFKGLVQYYDRSIGEAARSLRSFLLDVNGPITLMIGVLAFWLVLLPDASAKPMRRRFVPVVASFFVLYAFNLRSPFSDEQRYELVLLVPMVLALYLLMMQVLIQLRTSRMRLATAVAALLSGLWAVGTSANKIADQIRARTDTYMYVQKAREDAGRWLEANTPPGTRVVSSDIGALSFFNPSNIYLDAAGLVNRTQLSAVIEGRDIYEAMKSQQPQYLVDTIAADGLSGVEQILGNPKSYYVDSSGAKSSCRLEPIFEKKVLKTFPDNPPAGLRVRISKIVGYSC